ncbi:MAG: hypothetical protein FJY18_06295 [Bacteroidetes bacterium]|nr:hypothetical protein [Bacteroidota bacterium]
MKKIIFIISSLFLVGLLSVLFLLPDDQPSIVKPEPQYEEVYGIDVSHHQKNINWDQVSKSDKIIFNRRTKINTSERVEKKSKVQFCILKATEGVKHVDKRFKRNLSGCMKYKIPRTCYHYYRFKRDPKKQAQNFINQVPKSQINLPPAIDVEQKYNEAIVPSELRKNPLLKKQLIQELKILSDELEKHYGQKPIFYTSLEYIQLIVNNFPDNPIWIHDLRPVKSPKCDWVFWQISIRGQIKGITGPVDINKFNGNKKDFYKYVNK